MATGTMESLWSKANQTQLAPVENGTTVSRAYAVGEYFCKGGLLYRVTTAISSGGAITPGTNCAQDTVGTQIGYQHSTWTPSNATAIVEDRCYYILFGHLLVINVAVRVSSALATNSEVVIFPNISGKTGRSMISLSVCSSYAVARETGTTNIPLRLQYSNNELSIRNDSGGSIGTNKQIYGQIVIGVI